jgi:hypothetical protein
VIGRRVLAGSHPPTAAGRLCVEYVLPLRWDDNRHHAELTAYLHQLAECVDVTVVDGSEQELFEAHHRAWSFVRHVVPHCAGANGKARGAMTGVMLSRHERVIIADDDVRYDAGSLRAIVRRLDHADFVRPQNYFAERPWHARWDTGRSLLNRAFGGDYSGTVVLRASTLTRAGGYDTDVLFENLELERTVRAAGGRAVVAMDLYVARTPPSSRRFGEQRVRQAYDDFARPFRLAIALLVLPAVGGLVVARRARYLVVGAGAVVLAAEFGRRRAGGSKVFGRFDALWALPWVAERSVTAWAAVALRLRGGVRYRGARLSRAASSVRRLRRELQRSGSDLRAAEVRAASRRG